MRNVWQNAEAFHIFYVYQMENLFYIIWHDYLQL